jgi:hypothetical protein
MALPWTFGVELEFTVAFVYPHNVPLPDPAETRKLRFKPHWHEIEELIEQSSLPEIAVETQLADRNTYRPTFMRQLIE